MKFSIKRLFDKTNNMFLYAILGLFIAVLLNQYVCQKVRVTGSSMEPTFHDGNNLFMEKISYRIHTPNRFDIIVFTQNGDYFLIKRIIGMPYETVFINNIGEIFIDGQLLEENYGKDKMLEAGVAGCTVKLGENEYFVLGDNRNASLDSRNKYIGNVKLEDITGKIVR